MIRPRALLPALSILAIPAAAHAAEPTLRVDLGGGVALELVLVPASTFTQGSPPAEKGRADDEPQRQVTLTQPYYIGKTPVTVGQFGRFVSVTGYRTEAERGASGGFGWDGKALAQRKEFTWKNPGFSQTDDHPVTIVSYDDALAFTAWISRAASRSFSLPTEAQWENAYRAGTRGAWYDGASEKDALALGWFKDNAPGGTRPVGHKKPNALGLFDMAGDVYEWCADWYAPYAGGSVTDPVATQPDASDKPRRVLRGGSWLKEAKHGRAAARYRNAPGSRNADNGFRVAAVVAPPPAPEAAPDPSPPPRPEPPPPPASKTKASTGPASSDGVGTLMGLGCVGSFMLAIIALAVTMLRRGKGSGAPVKFRRGADGFWIDAPPNLRGSTLHYRHRTTTGTHEGHVVLEGGKVGQFVYTGGAPLVVELVRLIRPQPAPSYRQAAPPAPRGQQGAGGARGGSVSGGGGRVSGGGGVVVVHHHHHHHHHDEPQHHHHHHDEHRHEDPPQRDDDTFRGFPSAY